MNFFDFECNDALKKQLNSLSQSNRMPHAVIIEGGNPQKCEKLAELLSMWAVCSSENERPCGKCKHCVKAMGGGHSSINKIAGSTKSGNIAIEDIRKIIHNASIIPNEGDTNVFIIYDCDKKLSVIAQNAFLKVLEEPPQSTLFIMTCEKSQGLLQTIRSRASIFTLDAENGISEDAVKLAKQIVLGIIDLKEISLLLAAGKLTDKEKVRDVLPCVIALLRDGLALSVGGKADTDVETAQKLQTKLTKSKLLSLIDITNNALVKTEQNVNLSLLATWLCGEYRRISWQR